MSQSLASTTLLFSTLLLLMAFGCDSGQDNQQWEISNPYENVDWENDVQYKAALHTHTTLSDGRFSPQAVVDLYHQHGYDILSITDHDHVTYPWTEFTEMEPGRERYKELGRRRLENGMISKEQFEYDNRDPSELGMIAIQGSEVTQNRPHNHINSFFSDYQGSGSSRMETTLEETAKRNGLIIWNHPYMSGHRELISQLTDDPIGWYVDKYHRFDHLIGMEMNNNRHDHLIWDAVLSRIMPDRPVWGFSNDDFHTMPGFGRNWNTFILPELSKEWVRRGMEEGRFFMVLVPDGLEGPAPPVIESINIDRQKGSIHIQASGYETVEWISGGKVVSESNPVNLDELPEVDNYIRAFLYAQDGRTYIGTQPFGIRRPSAEKKETSPQAIERTYRSGDGVTDIDGNVYETTNIGNQEWMAENLRVTHYRDGSAIDFHGTDYDSWRADNTGAYAWYDNNEDRAGETYGALYNFHAVDNHAGLCPDGWRVPTDDDWKELEKYLGMSYDEVNVAGSRGSDIAGLLKSTRTAPDNHPRWNSLMEDMTNESGFSALPGGFLSTTGYSIGEGEIAYWWTATDRNPSFAWVRKIQNDYTDITRLGFTKNLGLSVRCLKN